MLFTRIFLVNLLFFSPFLSRGQRGYTIPFHLTEYNNLSIQAILNEKDTVNLMFHTAANSATLTAEAIKKLKSVYFNGKTDSIKSWGSDANSSRLSNDNSIRMGRLSWKHVSLTENTNSGQYTDGKFGIDLFKDRVIEIDFDNSTIRIFKRIPKKINKYEKVKLISRDDNLFIEAGCNTKDSSIKNNFLIHSGYAGAILFDDQFAADTRLNDKLQVTGEKILTDSYGNKIKVKQVSLPGLEIQNLKLADVPAGFFEGAIGRQRISVLGGDILKRFNMVIDARREYIYLKPSKWMNSDYRKM